MENINSTTPYITIRKQPISIWLGNVTHSVKLRSGDVRPHPPRPAYIKSRGHYWNHVKHHLVYENPYNRPSEFISWLVVCRVYLLWTLRRSIDTSALFKTFSRWVKCFILWNGVRYYNIQMFTFLLLGLNYISFLLVSNFN